MNYYFHIPFCRSKCGYCAFYSEPGPKPDAVRAYLDRLQQELETFEPEGRCETIYLGGGTPTLLPEPELERLFTMIHRTLAPTAETEISIESNPETLTDGKIALLRSFATRLSMGVQSFDPALRATLGRSCSQQALEHAVMLVQDAEFPHWNCDLIYAIPGQSYEMFRSDLETARQLGSDHLSCYNLTPEEGARLAAELIPNEEDAADMWELAEMCGLPRYEISNYAIPGSECLHNINVWRGGLLRGFGPAAASFDGRKRFTQVPNLRDWLAGVPAETDEIPPEERRNEIFAVNLRTTAGWTPELWAAAPCHDDWERRLAAAHRAAAETSKEWFAISPERITLTTSGLLFWNTIAETLL